MSAKKIAIIGGGINGLFSAWELAKSGFQVTLFERDEIMRQTSQASSKMLHGGLRYLENYEFRLVKEALRERAWWLNAAPDIVTPLKLYLPVYHANRRPVWMIRLGLWLYDVLAGKQNVANHVTYSGKTFAKLTPELKHVGIKAGFAFFDVQMDDYHLGLWVADQAQQAGVEILEQHEVTSLTEGASISGVYGDNNKAFDQTFDFVVNLTGPWADKLLSDNSLSFDHHLDLVRGSHIIIEGTFGHGFLLEVPNERRIFFVLPYQGKTLIGTTEVRQTLDEEIKPSFEEKTYLLDAYNHYFKEQKSIDDIVGSFAGVRPLIKSRRNPNKATREYALERHGKLLTVFGGKWTTSRKLGQKVTEEVNNAIH
jgi:glycerol-3-phosphate dehydrogenase